MSKRTGRDADPRRTIPLNTARWQRLRRLVLADSPLCAHCYQRGLIVPATDVDHVSGDPSDNSQSALQSLCHTCHSRKTAADHGKRVAQGCDIDGIPLDPAHPWRIAKNRQQPSALDRPRRLPLPLSPEQDHDATPFPPQ